MLTPIGVLGGIRGVFFANFGGGSFTGQDYRWFSSDPETVIPVVGFERDANGFIGAPIQGEPTDIDGFRLVDSRASYGIGLETFLIGFPVHFDWAWRTLFNRQWEDALFAAQGGSSEFRKPQFKLWIGYDF